MSELNDNRRGDDPATDSDAERLGGSFTPDNTPVSPYSQSLLDSSLFWLSLGAALIPCQPDRKFQIAGFGDYGRCVSTKTEARFWFSERRANLALATGGGLVALDFDRLQDFAAFTKLHPYLCETLTEQTPRGGVHLYFLCTQSDRLRSGPTPDKFEIKAAGGAVLVAPSVVGGVRYTVITPPPVMRRDDLADHLRLFLLSETHRPNLEGKGQDLVARCKLSLDILALAQDLQRARGIPVAWHHSPDGAFWYSYCPFHHDTDPSFMVNVKRGFYKCRSCGERGDGLNLYQVLHGLPDVQSAIAEVASRLPAGGGQ